MNHWEGLGKILVILGLLLGGVGLILIFLPKIPWLGKLPGDLFFRRGNFTFYFPLVSCLLLSLLLTLFFRIFRR
ncbi:MAG: DUF2905 domain-containing protein [Thermodesulfobacteriota bacterium]